MPSEAISHFCDPFAHGNSTVNVFSDFAFGKWTPCVEEIAILGTVHVVMILVCLLRLCMLCFRKYKPFKDGLACTKLALCGLATLMPILQLTARLGESTATDGHNSKDYLYGTSDFLPFELVSYILSISAWGCCFLVVGREYFRGAMRSGFWTMRFIWLFAFFCQTIKLYFVVRRVDDGAPINYFFDLFFVQYGIIALLGLHSVCYYPEVYTKAQLEAMLTERMEEQERRQGDASLVPLTDSASASLLADHETSSSLHVSSMDRKNTTCPEFTSGFFSRLFFTWITPLIRSGYKKPLDDEDVWQLHPYDTAESVSARFRRCWGEEMAQASGSNGSNGSNGAGLDAPLLRQGKGKGKGKDSLWCCCLGPRLSEGGRLFRALRSTFGARFALGGLIKLLNDASQFTPPIFLNLIVNFISSHQVLVVQSHINEGSGGEYKGYVYAVLIFLSSYIGSLGECQYFQIVMRSGMQVRSALVCQIFRQSMVLSAQARSEQSTGKIANLMSSDCEAIQMACQYMHNLWSAPLRVIISLVLLYQQLGPSSLVGLAVLLVAFPLQKKLMGIRMKFMKKGLGRTDQRVKVENEIVGSMAIVKMYDWTGSFGVKVSELRQAEVEALRKSAYVYAVYTFLVQAIPVLVTVSTFGVFAASGGQLTPAVAFTSLSLFGVLRMPLFTLPNVVDNYSRMLVSLGRIQAFLESDTTVGLLEGGGGADGEGEGEGEGAEVTAVSVPTRDYYWSLKAPAPTLRLVSPLRVPRGRLTAIIGRTGSGKSSLLSAMLGDMNTLDTRREAKGDHGEGEGEGATIRGSVAYVPQQSWIFNATVRENILFGLDYDSFRYDHAVSAACLGRDFELLADGDRTEIGEKGVNLSGGQKQRVSIARAVYANADVYLLDDCLSALDASVAKQVNDLCIHGALKDKTRVFVTNRLEFVPQVDDVVFMRNGEVAAHGPYARVMESSRAVKEMMHEAALGHGDEDNDGDDDGEGDDGVILTSEADADKPSTTAAAASDEEEKEKKGKKSMKSSTSAGGSSGGGIGQLIKKEAMSRGSLKTEVIAGYVTAMGGKGTLGLIVFLFSMNEFGRLISSYWLSWWSAGTLPGPQRTVTFYICIYALLSMTQTLVNLCKQFCLAKYGLVASSHLHDAMWTALSRARMSFFNTTPMGRLQNRLSKDLGDADRSLMNMTSTFVSGMVQLFGALVIIGVTTYYTLAAYVPVLACFFWLQRKFQATSRELKRLDSVSRSPIYSHFSQCLNGMSSIRAYGAQSRMIAESGCKLDNNIRMNVCSFSTNRWLSVRLEFLGGLMVFSSAVFAVAMRGVIGAEEAALALSYALQITGLVNMTTRLASVAENSFNAVERIQEYAEVESEAADEVEPAPPAEWPTEGAMTFDNVVASYRPELPPVLRGLSFDVAARQKVGVVGRTGAGKSSLFLTLFRIVEPSSGKIVIDGVDLATLGLSQLRRRLSIIPQDPVLFSGTVKDNLDPFGRCTDAELWKALQLSHMAAVVGADENKLAMHVAESGDNFSVGQRQLLCLARALVRKSKVLVLDEATAGVDADTDALIQATIRSAFAACTTLTIAHRLNTIIDSDLIVVLDAGKCVETDSPERLLSCPSSVFTSMVEATGPQNASALRHAASAEGRKAREQELARAAEAAQQKASAGAGVAGGGTLRNATSAGVGAGVGAGGDGSGNRPALQRRFSLSQLDGVQLEDSYFEEVRSAIVTLDQSVKRLGAPEVQQHLEEAGVTREGWLRELQRLVSQVLDGIQQQLPSQLGGVDSAQEQEEHNLLWTLHNQDH